RQPGQTLAEHLAEAFRYAQRLACRRARASANQLAADLESKERVPCSRLVDADKLGSGQLQVEPLLQQGVDSADGERADRQLFDPPLRERPTQLERNLQFRTRPKGREQSDALLAEPPQRDLDGTGGRLIEPLQIIESDEH